MRLIALSLTLLIMSCQLTAHVFAYYTEMVVVEKNIFRTGEVFMQVSHIDSNGDGIADPDQINWKKTLTAVASSPDDLLPGESFSSRFFVRNQGNLDIPKLELRIGEGGMGHPDFFANFWLDEIWYDRNANGVKDEGEDLRPALMVYDANNDGILSYPEIFKRSILLEKDGSILPGSKSNPTIGGYNGTGKAINLTWRLNPAMTLDYSGQSQLVDYQILARPK